MKDRNTSIIITVVAVILCGCPGLIGLCFGSTFALVGFIPGAEIDVFGSAEPRSAIITGLVTVCLSVLFIAVPALLGYFLLGKNKNKDPLDDVEILDQDLPPAM